LARVVSFLSNENLVLLTFVVNASGLLDKTTLTYFTR